MTVSEKANGTHKPDSDADALEDYSYTTQELGVWRLLLPVSASSNSASAGKRKLPIPLPIPIPGWRPRLPTAAQWSEVRANARLLWRFAREIYLLNPMLNVVFFLLKLSTGVEGTLLLYTSGQLLRTVEAGLVSGRPDPDAIVRAVLLRVLCSILSSIIQWSIMRVAPILQNQVTAHFEAYMLRERLRLDLPTSKDKNTGSSVHVFYLWHNFQYLCGVFERLFRLISQIVFTIQQPSGGITLTLLSLVSPVLGSRLRANPFNGPFLYYAWNADYLRASSLNMFMSEEYREEIIAGNIGGWIMKEYERARAALGTISNANPHSQYSIPTNPLFSIVSVLSTDLPTFYWAASALLQPNAMSVTSFAILQQHATALRFTVANLFSEFESMTDCVSMTRDLYKMEEVTNKIVDGDEAYPNAELSTEKGMAFELRNVSFAYPGSTTKQNAIRNISLTIPAGSLVVIVGPNGSGKSTIIKLLTRLYDVDSGAILVDGRPITAYRLADLRKVQALLTQEHKLYPMTLRENIGLGDPERGVDAGPGAGADKDKEKGEVKDGEGEGEGVRRAAEAAGAAEVVGRMKDGYETNLSPAQTAYGSQLEEHTKLKEILENLEQRAEVSGGEKQRLVAARTFMRFSSGKIRFAVADEPSSALDPKAEHRLFKHLRESGEGKTMIFVTHRFGHLTKFADLIICMKDGEAVEIGTHKELMARRGEYSELYNVQAQAFSDAVL
ncbi:P-loop containing nucleoside triphosphate hydrolase protein [Mycena filopes]|nr:P-loop containing nucleoside triphosphate hydrolase protein [Mycena filopes]